VEALFLLKVYSGNSTASHKSLIPRHHRYSKWQLIPWEGTSNYNRGHVSYPLKNEYVYVLALNWSEAIGKTNWYQTCSYSRRLVPLFAPVRLHRSTSSEEKRKKVSPIFSFHFLLYRWCSVTQYSKLGDYNIRNNPIELDLLHTITYTYTFRVRTNLKRTITTKELISIWLLWTFHSYEAS